MLLLLAPAYADQLVAGDQLRIHYDSTGTWNDQGVGAGLEVLHEGTWLDWAYPGYPWHTVAVEYTAMGADLWYYASSNTSSATFDAVTEADLSSGSYAASVYTYTGDGLTLTQTQGWATDSRVVRVSYQFDASVPLEDPRLLFELDTDPDYTVDGTYDSLNDTVDTDGDGVDDLTVSESPARGWTLAFGACEPGEGKLGHVREWSSSYRADQSLEDDDGDEGDHAMGILLEPGDLAAGSSVERVFLVIAADSPGEAELAWEDARGLCDGCDGDGDGYTAALCGGDDCDDADAAVHPGAEEIWYDGEDQDCLGGDDYDRDADGSPYGKDCDDTNPGAYPGGVDSWYDGVDGDCDGASDYDADVDGYDSADWGGADCDDDDASLNPGATETWYDDVDQDCDGNDTDQDGDSYPFGEDCDDQDPEVYPGAPGNPHDGRDSDCDGQDEDTSGDTGIKIEGTCTCGNADGAGATAAGLALLLLSRRRRQSSGTT